MTSLNDRIKQLIHYSTKPFYRALISSVYSPFAEIVREKDKKGWDVELIQRFRRAFKRWEERKIDYGSLVVKIHRPHLRMLFDLICLMGEVEPLKVEKGWKAMKEELRKEGLI